MNLKLFSERKKDIYSVIFLVLITLLFFGKLFFPDPKIFITPEYGSSDIPNLNYPFKDFLSQSLKKNQIPLWTTEIGTGFPLLAESQIGTFYLPNIILFKFLPTWLAFNIGFILTFLIAEIGMYCYVRFRGLNRLIGIFSAITFSFSGFFIGHIRHYNMFQSAAFLPWIILLAELCFKKRQLIYIIIFSLVLSQQIFIGHVQVTFIILVFVSLIPLLKDKLQFKNILKDYLLLLCTLIIAVCLSAIQILPTFELFNLSVRGKGFSSSESISSSIPLNQLVWLINPFSSGNIANGSYSDEGSGNIYWENIMYIGIIPLIFLILSLIKSKENYKFFLIPFLISIFLMLGKYSPAYIIYSFFPFSLFRLASRFNLIFIFYGTILASLYLNSIKSFFLQRKRFKLWTLFLIIIITITTGDFFYRWINYYPTVSVSRWLEIPPTAEFVNKSKIKSRVINLDNLVTSIYGKYYLKNGWIKTEPYYYFRNDLVPNQNLLWNISQYRSYVAVLWTRRYIFLSSILNNNVLFNEKKSLLIPNNISKKILNINNIGYIISTNKISDKNIRLVFEVKDKTNTFPSYKIYQNFNVLPRARFVYSYRVINSSEEFINYLRQKYNPQKEAIITQNIQQNIINCKIDCENQIKWIKDENQNITLSVYTKKNGLLILADSYYPGWKAFIDNKSTNIIAANINQRAIIVPEGRHEVVFKYQPMPFFFGLIISVISHLTVIIFLSYHFFRKLTKNN